MDYLSILLFSTFALAIGFVNFADAARFSIINNCSYSVRAAAVPGGGKQLGTGVTWIIDVPPGTVKGRIWARIGCKVDASDGGSCPTGPNTVAEYALDQFSSLDFFDISLVDGFNVPMEFSPTSGNCSSRGAECTGDINGQCPTELRTTNGCNDPCTVFKTNTYCCTLGRYCVPTIYSKFFKARCPDAYSYPKDDQTSTFTCPSGTDYKVVFCP